MSNSKLFRIGGWCALAAAFTMLAAVISFIFSGGNSAAGLIGSSLEYISLLLLIFVFFALYADFRSESAGLSLVGLILLVVAIVIDVIANFSSGNITLSNLWYLLLSLPFLIYGYLTFRSPSMSRGFALVGLLTGVTYLISGVSGLLGNQNIANIVSVIAAILMLVWEVWLWRVFWSKSDVKTAPKLRPA